MVPVTKDTLLVVATVVCAIALVFLFKEMNKAKKDIDGFKNFSAQVVRHLTAPEPVPVETAEKKEEIEEEKSEE